MWDFPSNAQINNVPVSTSEDRPSDSRNGSGQTELCIYFYMTEKYKKSTANAHTSYGNSYFVPIKISSLQWDFKMSPVLWYLVFTLRHFYIHVKRNQLRDAVQRIALWMATRSEEHAMNKFRCNTSARAHTHSRSHAHIAV